jgi:adenylate kinase family enzyme
MQRILIVGICGAGKSTLARELATRLGLPLIHLDKEYWQPGWKVPDEVWWRARVQELAAGDRWIMDGSYSSTLHLRLPRADTIIHLDFPRRIALYRILKRVFLGYGRTRPDLADNCPEHFDWDFLKFTWNFRRDVRPKVESFLSARDPNQTIFRLCRSRDVRQFLDAIGAGLTL